MTYAEYSRLKEQLGVLRSINKEYKGRTIENIIQNIEDRISHEKKN